MSDSQALLLRGEQMVASMDAGGVLPCSEARLAVGATGVGLSLLIFVGDGSVVAGRLFSWNMFLLLAALLLALTGLGGLQRRCRRAREVERAVGEWHTLRLHLTACSEPGRWLQQRGYREFEVRRWIVREVSKHAPEVHR